MRFNSFKQCQIVGMVIVLVAGFVLSANAEIPGQISYQGMLTDEMGTPLNGEYQIKFNIYGSETGTDSLWSSGYQTVQVDEGLFIYRLGSNVPLPDDLFAGSAVRYLGITVSPDLEIEPRTRFLAVPYAYHALSSETSVDSKWTVTDSVLYTNNYWGLARGGAGNVLYGDSAYTMVNLGVACITGMDGSNFAYATVGGGWQNFAGGGSATIGGGEINSAGGTAATISGGYMNSTSESYATIGGGAENTVAGRWATVGGGLLNSNYSELGTIGGGHQNSVSGYAVTVGGGHMNSTSGDSATVGGGSHNSASSIATTVAGGISNTASGYAATVSGGESNSASGDYTAIAGGYSNSTSQNYGTVGGGYYNSAGDYYTTIGGGYYNSAGGQTATIGGGWINSASGGNATVGGGWVNSASGSNATVGGGSNNSAGDNYATVGGGGNNSAIGDYATIPGGRYNSAGAYSFAAGHNAKADSAGSFVWADNAYDDFTSSAVNGFHVRASGGVYLYTSSDLSTGAYLSSGSGTWSSVCDRTLKRNIREVDYQDMVERVVALPVSKWSYKTQDESIEHVGPMAQDFHRLFGLGEDDKHLTSLDLAGISLAAIKGLYEINQQQKAQLDRQAKEISNLKEELLRLTLMIEGKADID